MIGSILSSTAKSVLGFDQMNKANRALADLEGQEPEIYVPTAIRNRASEPIAVEFMEAQEEGRGRRTAQSIGALQQTGSRGVLGGLGRVLDSERQLERQQLGQYEQERKRALGALGKAETDVQRRKMSNYLSKIQAAQRALEAGQQNVVGGIQDVGQTFDKQGEALLSVVSQGGLG